MTRLASSAATPRPLRCHRCGSPDLALNEVIQEHARYDGGLFIDESGAIRARGEGIFSPGASQPRLTEIECLNCGHWWHPRRAFAGPAVSLATMWDTLGLWLGPTLALVLAAVGTKWLGWFQPRSRRRIALQRIAERLAYEDTRGYDYRYDRWLEHYLGGRHWRDELDKADTRADDGTYHDAREPAPNWRQKLVRRAVS